ncbi:hypothetical protein ACE5JW_10730 [Acinetobacter radioresistens]|jgi:hypothetical protein|nr:MULTISPECIES: hypothetical protein [Acinetobacter]ENV85078.1 hypothetical protein F940_02213 [Acinetobacter radioresistens NIPH 2130]EXB87594.1 hypothetical protein J538_0482 [Acinetobacter sp. 272263]EXE58121.1 hypothetical protein J579_1548 [Acinetobacter sp. 1239920]MBA5695589.1 hypothetical protein [Acinetobacter radioresistens]MBA5698601.1 hypothetical protein [Acinetobacter radioresistens]
MIPYIFIFFMVVTFPTLIWAENKSPEEIRLKEDSSRYKSYIPRSYRLTEVITGDLNKDRKTDVVLIVKATDPAKWVNDEYQGKLDRNRRGIIVLVNENGQYKKIIQNLSCFSSEYEDGGVYYAPELLLSVEQGLLNVHYAHGRYGYWRYRFQLKEHDLQLVGYDNSDNFGPYINSQTSINYLTQRKLVRENINKNRDDDIPKFKETWYKMNQAPVYLSKIKDFDRLN